MLRLIRALAYRLRTRPLAGRLALMLIPDWRWTTRVEGIGPFQIRLRRNRSYWLRKPLESEHFPFSMLRRMVRPGEVVYDAGANLGLYCRYLVEQLGAGRVVAFEPMSDNRPMLAKNLALGGIEEAVQVLPVALADFDGEADFQVDDMQSSSGSLDQVTGGEPAQGRRNLGLAPLTERVTCRRLDSLVAEQELPLPDLIKIDVEGAEALVLAGASKLLSERGPRLFVELHGIGEIGDVLTLLDRHGYHCRGRVREWIHPSGYGPVDRSLIPHLRDQYDVHFLVAAKNPEDLPSGYDPEAPL